MTKQRLRRMMNKKRSIKTKRTVVFIMPMKVFVGGLPTKATPTASIIGDSVSEALKEAIFMARRKNMIVTL